MRPLSLKLLLLVLSFVSLSSFSNEYRSNPDLRERIKAFVARSLCERSFEEASLPVRSRGITRRGLTRGATDVRKLPSEVQKFSDLYSMVILAELNLPYGKKGHPKAHVFFWKDPETKLAEKIKSFEELGFVFDARGAPLSVPTWIEFAKHYRAALERRGVKPEETLVPAIVLYRSAGTSIDKDGKVVEKREYRLLTPSGKNSRRICPDGKCSIRTSSSIFLTGPSWRP